MYTSQVTIDASQITDWKSFHDVFAQALGFPTFYGGNMNAWIDCMSSLDAPEDAMSRLHCEPGKVMTLIVQAAAQLKELHPAQYAALIECTAFVNWRRMQSGRPAVLALAFDI